MLYLHWYEDNKTIPLAQRLAAGAAAYAARFRQQPNVVQVSLDEPGECGQAERIRELTKNNYRFGYETPRYPSPDTATATTAPALAMKDGVLLEYVPGSLLDGGARYQPREGR